MTVETVTERTEHATGKELWDWIVCSNPIAERMLGDMLNLTDAERATVQQALESMVRRRAGRAAAATLTNPVHIGFGTK